MAIVTDTVAVQRFAMGLFGVQVGTVTMAQVDKQIDRTSLSETLNSYYTSAFGGQTTAAVAATLVANLGITGAGVDGAVAYVTGALNAAAPAARGEAVSNIINLFSGLTADATYGAAAQTWNANVDVASGYTGTANIAFGSVIQQSLTAGMDILFGSAGGDVFTANVVQNMLGQQTNTLGSGDAINGGAGTDTLNAKVTAGVSGSGSESMPIQAETKSVEIIKIEAVSSYMPGYNDNTQVYINAKDMEGVSQLWSNRSDADLVVMNMTTKGTKQLSDMTIGMAYTGNKDSKWGASDATVYFDQDYLTSAKSSTNPSIDFLAMNEDNYDASKGAAPLEGVYFQRLNFTLNGKSYNLAQYLGEKAEGKGDEIKTYAQFLTAVQAGLVKLKAANPDDAALQTVTAELGRVFETDKDPLTNDIRKGTTVQLTVDAQTGTTKNTLSVKETDLQVSKTDAATVPNSNRYEKAGATPALESDLPVSINVALEKVGLAGDGGNLVIGSMNKTDKNAWNAVKTSVSSTKAGIEQFNVTVSGDATKNSSLAGLYSTNNMLKTVNVVSAAGSTAKLTIGNSNTEGGSVVDALKDVKTFDASKFDNGLTLGARITGESVAKYMSLTDTDAPGDDNAAFVYTFGKGNDALIMNISKANLSAPGSTTREDFSLNISTDEGNDTVNVQIGDGTGQATDAWFINSDYNDNLDINTGAGDDTVNARGAGTWNITTGEGNDTVYSDNSGKKAVWVFNTSDQIGDAAAATTAKATLVTAEVAYTKALNTWLGNNIEKKEADFRADAANDAAVTAWTAAQAAYAAAVTVVARDLNNLQSDANDTYKLFKGEVTVNFHGLKVTKVIDSSNYLTTDLEINQAIKDAINSDTVLGKLLKATDGPANTLVVTSLIDGDQTGALSIDINQGATWTPAEKTAAEAAWAKATPTKTDFSDYEEVQFAVDMATSTEITGLNSAEDNVNQIQGDAGKDVIVLSSNVGSDDKEVVVLNSAIKDQADVIVNFTAGEDKIQLSKAVFGSTVVIGTAPVAASTAAAVLYNIETGVLSYDADGTGTGAAVVIATLTGHPDLKATDFAIVA